MTKNWTGLGLAASAVGTMLSFGSALAADMPVKALVPALAFIDWSGVYIGVHAGYGGGMKDYSGNFIPSVPEVQQGIFKSSLLGPAIQNNLGALLIQSTAPGKKPAPKH